MKSSCDVCGFKPSQNAEMRIQNLIDRNRQLETTIANQAIELQENKIIMEVLSLRVQFAEGSL